MDLFASLSGGGEVGYHEEVRPKPSHARGLVVVLSASGLLTACQLLSGVSDYEVIDANDAAADVDSGADAAGTNEASTADDGSVSDGSTDASEDAASDGGLDGAGDAAGDADAGPTVALSVTIDIVPGASITSIDVVGGPNICAGAACASAPSTKSIQVPLGSSVSVRVSKPGDQDARFTAPDSCKATSDCALTMDTAKSASVQVTANNYVFVTSSTFDGNLGGVAGADMKCATAATQAGLPGTYKAWLATSGAGAATRLSGARGWVRVDGKPVADTVSPPGLQSGKIFYPISLDEAGSTIPSATPFAFTGSNPDGSAVNGFTCGDWVNAAGSASLGAGFAGPYRWTSDRLDSCATGRLYCFGVSRSAPLTLSAPPATHRIAFLSSANLTMTGVAAADQICATEATNVGLAGTFKAWIATTARSADSPFNLSVGRGGWYRPDGMPIFVDPGQLGTAQAFPETPIAQLANGGYVSSSVEVWTGMATTNGIPFDTQSCVSWTSAAGTGYVGAGSWAGRDGVSSALSSCSSTNRVYCLQE